MKYKFYFWLILITGTIVRLFYIFASPYGKSGMNTCDICTIGLMAKHILAGEFPLFFYGQYYLGPLEAIITASFFIIFGIKMEIVYLSVLLFSILFMAAAYRLAAILKDARVGLFAMIYAAFPPAYFFGESVTPAGYHIEIPLLGTVFFITVIKARTENNSVKKIFYYVISGALAGIGFWTHYIILFYIIPAVIYLLIHEKLLALLRNGIIAAIAGFLASLPFWIFTLQNDFCTLRFGSYSTPDRAAIASVIKAYIDRITCMISSNLLSKYQFVLILLYLATLLYFIINNLKQKKFLYKNETLLTLFFISLSFVYIYYKTRMVAGSAFWYLLPVISFIPICFAYFVDRVSKWNIYLGGLILFGVIFLNILDIKSFIEKDKWDSEQNKKTQFERINFLDEIGVNRIYGNDRLLREPEFYTNERIIASAFEDGDYFPHEDEADAAERVAFEQNDADFTPALNNICESYKYENYFYYDFKPFRYLKKSITPINWHAISNKEIYSAKLAFDRNYDSWWLSRKSRKIGDYFQVDLGKPYQICSVKMCNGRYSANSLSRFKIDVSVDGENWRQVCEISHTEPAFWSGPRIYWRYYNGRIECFFKPVTARFLRLTNLSDDKKNPWGIKEIFIYEYIGEKSFNVREYVKDLKEAVSFLNKHHISFVYADYWPSAKIRKITKGKIDTLVPNNTWRPFRKNMSREVYLTNKKALVAAREDTGEIENILSEFGIPFKRANFNQYVCFYFPDSTGQFRPMPVFMWSGFGLLKYSLKYYSMLLYESGDYKGALKYYPNNYLACGKCQILPSTRFVPKTEKNITFLNGIEFLGYSIRSKNIRPGKVVRIEYFWKIENELKDELSVFVYFMKDNKIAFQNDHAFLFQFPRPLSPLEGERFREVLKLKIPEDLEKGPYQIVIGLWDEIKKKRIKIKDLKGKRVAKFTIGELVVE